MIVSLNFLQQKLHHMGQTLSYTPSLEVLVGIASKILKLHSSIQKDVPQALCNLQKHLQQSLGPLRIVSLVHLMQEITCPNQNGLYFFQRFSWQKGTSRVFLLLYYFLSTSKFTAKLGFIQIKGINRIVFWNFSFVNLLIQGTYLLSRVFTALNVWQTKEWEKLVISVGKIAMIILGVIVTTHPLLKAVSLGIDCIDARYKGIL